MKKIYELHQTTKIPSDFEYAASLTIPKLDINNTLWESFLNYDSKDLPNILYFEAHHRMQLVQKYDYPYTNIDIPIMNQKMLEVLLSVAPFEYRTVPVEMVDDLYQEVGEKDGVYKPGALRMNNFVAILLPLQKNFLDMEKSTFRNHVNIFGVEEKRLSRPIFKEPKEGFPPIFRIEEKDSRIYISPDAKEALEKHNIQGYFLGEKEAIFN